MYQNKREELPDVDEATQAVFEQGHLVGDIAKSLYPDGIEIDWNDGQESGLARTREYLCSRRPLFEAGFVHGATHARADILVPAPRGRWSLIEVKSAGEVKDEHLEDVAFQKHVYEGAGVRISDCAVMHVNMQYERRGRLEPARLLLREDVTEQIRPLVKEVPLEVERMLAVIAKRKCPEPAMTRACAGCCLYGNCWSWLPERNVLCLFGGFEKGIELMDQGILRIADIPAGYPLTERQRIQVACEKSGRPHIDAERLRAFLSRLRYPLYFLDFETFNVAVPPYDRLRPYENIPFQYSLHVVLSPQKPARHDSWLSDGTTDPRPEFLRKLRSALGTRGSIVAYNASFEMNILKDCADHFPHFSGWVESVCARMVDLYTPFRNLHYYHPGQNGRRSLKDVLPALTRRTYKHLAIADGTTASLRFREMAFGNMSEAEKSRTRRDLEAYCRRDSEGMIAIVGALERLCR